MEETGEKPHSSSKPPPPLPPQPPFTLPPSTIPSSSSSTSNPPNPNPNSNSNSLSVLRPSWDPHTQYRHFSNTSTTQSSSSGMAIGVPANPPASFSSLNQTSFGHRGFPSTSTTPQVRPPIQGNQGIGMRGPIGSVPPMRAGGIAMQHQQRPVQSSVRPQTTQTNQPLTSQNLQGHVMTRGPAVGSPASPSPGTSQAHNQPWLSSRPPLPNAPFRAQMNHPQSLQQRTHIPQQMHHPVSMPSQRPQPPPSQHSQQSELQILKTPGIGNQKFVANSVSQQSTVSTGLPDKTASLEIVETCNRIISKRSIQELVAQIDPTEILDPEVEDILVGIADDFVESITSSACSLAKHRKSTTLEAKDILLHLDRNWNMTLPGFTGDEIKCFKKPFVNDIHKERLAMLKKSVAAGDVVKSSTGQAAGSAKGHLAKAEFPSGPNTKRSLKWNPRK